MTSCGISSPFELLSHASGQVTNALLTRSPLSAIANTPFDLHVLGTPPAFILSQDRTLRIYLHASFNASYPLTHRNLKCPSYHSSVVKVLAGVQLVQTKCRCLDLPRHRPARPTSLWLWSLTLWRLVKLSAICPYRRDLVRSKCVHYYTLETWLVKRQPYLFHGFHKKAKGACLLVPCCLYPAS
jgi:hypothetical protein